MPWAGIHYIVLPSPGILELAINQRFEIEKGRPGGRWKAESHGFPTVTIRAPEDITSSSYGRFEIVPPPAGNGAAGADARTDGWMDGHRRLCTPPYKMLSNSVASMVSVSITFPLNKGELQPPVGTVSDMD